MERKTLLNRRKKIHGLYLMGFNLIDMARYFEVTTTAVRRSLDILRIDSETISPETDLIKTHNLLKMRDAALDMDRENKETLYQEGFWRFPDAFSDNPSAEALAKELRAIGISISEIKTYLGTDIVTATRSHQNKISLEQIQLSEQLLEEGWSVAEISEYCGICLGKIPKYKMKTKRSQKSETKKAALEELRKKLYQDYISGIKQNQLAKDYNLSRHTVISYLNQYCQKHPEAKRQVEQKKKENMAGRNRTHPKDIIEKLLPYLKTDKGGKITLKGTIEQIALECGLSEVTVSKYQKIIEQNKDHYLL